MELVESTQGTGSTSARWPLSELALVLAAFVGVSLLQYDPALRGKFAYDDHALLVQNIYVHDLTLAHIVEIFDPRADPARIAAGYKPLNLIWHGLQWQLFGLRVLPYHVTNVVVHSLASLLLLLVLGRSGIPRLFALAGATLFLLHPANVEAVAWISQLKTTVCFALCMGVLLLERRHPGFATAVFVVALLTKLQAAFVLPVVGVSAWLDGRFRRSVPWLLVWSLCIGGYALAEISVTMGVGPVDPIHEDTFVWLRSIAAIAARYGVMAFTSYGIAPFHEPGPALSWLDPWWLGALILGVALLARIVQGVRNRSVELIFWVWAVVSFLPISQLIPFHYPMADRYLYFILPGLIGGVFHLCRSVSAQSGNEARRTRLAALGFVGIAALATVFGVRGHAQSRIWKDPDAVMEAAAQAYPDSLYASLRRATVAGESGDLEGVIRNLRAARELGFSEIFQMVAAPQINIARNDPRFRVLLTEIANEWVVRFQGRDDLSQSNFRYLGVAYYALGEEDAAIEALEAGIAHGGPYVPVLESDIQTVRNGPLYPEVR